MKSQCLEDVMQVCLNGHVITDLLLSLPEQGLNHCPRCGAATLSRCPTCGRPLPGAIPVPGLVPIGERRAPQHCPSCGASFPWTRRDRPLPGPLVVLETLLRRLPHAARQLRWRHGERPAFAIGDVYDLEDLLRAVLHLQFDDVRQESRTPSYSSGTRTDFVLGPGKIAVTAKLVTAAGSAPALAEELQEDVAYYERQQGYRWLVGFVYDPEQLVPEPRGFEAGCGRNGGELQVCCVVAW